MDELNWIKRKHCLKAFEIFGFASRCLTYDLASLDYTTHIYILLQ